MPEPIRIVEDHDMLRQTLHDWLQLAFPWRRIIPAPEGEEEAALQQSSSPSVNIMDVTLPRLKEGLNHEKANQT
jgi:DNA-binding NarL/FixJ family response regulator